MSLRSRLRERAGPRVQVRDVSPVPSGSPVRVRIRRTDGAVLDVPGAAVALVRRRLGYAKSHPALTRVAEGGDAVLLVPMVESVAALRSDLERCGLEIASRHRAPGR